MPLGGDRPNDTRFQKPKKTTPTTPQAQAWAAPRTIFVPPAFAKPATKKKPKPAPRYDPGRTTLTHKTAKQQRVDELHGMVKEALDRRGFSLGAKGAPAPRPNITDAVETGDVRAARTRILGTRFPMVNGRRLTDPGQVLAWHKNQIHNSDLSPGDKLHLIAEAQDAFQHGTAPAPIIGMGKAAGKTIANWGGDLADVPANLVRSALYPQAGPQISGLPPTLGHVAQTAGTLEPLARPVGKVVSEGGLEAVLGKAPTNLLLHGDVPSSKGEWGGLAFGIATILPIGKLPKLAAILAEARTAGKAVEAATAMKGEIANHIAEIAPKVVDGTATDAEVATLAKLHAGNAQIDAFLASVKTPSQRVKGKLVGPNPFTFTDAEKATNLKRRLNVGPLKYGNRRRVDANGIPYVGRITPEEAVARMEHATPDAAQRAHDAAFYQHVGPKLGAIMEDKEIMAWLASQVGASPSRGVLDLLRVLEAVAKGEQIPASGKGSIGLAAHAMRDILAGGTELSKGAAAKISDFIDSALQSPTRNWVGHHPRPEGSTLWGDPNWGGAPAVADRWGGRSAGLVDKAGQKQIKDRFGATVKADVGDGLTAVQYEQVAKFYHDMTDVMNARNFDGRADWTPLEVQAMDWAAIQRYWGVPPEDLAYAISANTRRVNLELTHGMQGLGEDLTIAQRQQVAQEMAEPLAQSAIQAGLRVSHIEHGTSAYEATQNVSMHIDLLPGGPEHDAAVKSWLDKISTELDQFEVWATKPGTSGGSVRVALRITAPGLHDLATQTRFWNVIRAEAPDLVGYMPFSRASGEQGIMIVTGKGYKNAKSAEETAQLYKAAIDKAEAEIGVPVTYDSQVTSILKGKGDPSGDVSGARRGGRGGTAGLDSAPDAQGLRAQLEAAIERARGGEAQAQGVSPELGLFAHNFGEEVGKAAQDRASRVAGMGHLYGKGELVQSKAGRVFEVQHRTEIKGEIAYRVKQVGGDNPGAEYDLPEHALQHVPDAPPEWLGGLANEGGFLNLSRSPSHVRTLGHNDYTAQLPTARSRITRKLIEDPADAVSRWLGSEGKAPATARWFLPTGSAERRVSKAAGRLREAETRRARNMLERARHDLPKENSTEDIAHYWWAQLPSKLRNLTGLHRVRGKLTDELKFLTDEGPNGFKAANAQEKDALKTMYRVLREGPGAAPGEITPGAYVNAADRDNWGKVVRVDGDEALVRFVNKESAYETEVWLAKDQLTPQMSAAEAVDILGWHDATDLKKYEIDAAWGKNAADRDGLPLKIEDLGAYLPRLDKTIAEMPQLDPKIIGAMDEFAKAREEILVNADHRQALDPERAASRKGIISRWLGEEPTDEEIFVGHRPSQSARERSGNPGYGGTGEPRAPEGVSENQVNKLSRVRSGRTRDSTHTVVDDWGAAQTFRSQIESRDDLGLLGRDFDLRIDRGYQPDKVLINRKGTVIPHSWKDDPVQHLVELGEDEDEVRKAAEEMIGQFTANSKSGWDEMVKAAEESGKLGDLRVVEKKTYDRYYAQFTPPRRAEGAAGKIGKGYDRAVDMAVGSIVFARLGYIPKNALANIILMVPHQGVYLIPNMARAAQVLRDPELRHLIAGAAGHGGTKALETEARGFAKKGASKAKNAPSWVTNKVTSVADLPWRVGAFLHEAAAEGVIPRLSATLSDKDRKALIDLATSKDQRAKLHNVESRSNEAMVDFSRLTPAQRRYARRFLIIPSWLWSGSRYPVHFALNHPLRSAAIGYVAAGEPGHGDLPHNKPAWEYLQGHGFTQGVPTPWGRFRTNSISPVSTPWDLGQAAVNTVRGVKPFSTDDTAWSSANPWVGMGQQFLSGGVKGLKGWERIGKQALPTPFFLKDMAMGPKESPTYGKETRVDRLKREAGVFPIDLTDSKSGLADSWKKGLKDGTMTPYEVEANVLDRKRRSLVGKKKNEEAFTYGLVANDIHAGINQIQGYQQKGVDGLNRVIIEGNISRQAYNLKPYPLVTQELYDEVTKAALEAKKEVAKAGG